MEDIVITRRGFGFAAAAGFLASGYELSTARAQVVVPDGSTIVLVRHADKEEKKKYKDDDDVPLTKAGEARAEALAETLRKTLISAIVTTKAVRTQQTAQPLDELLPLTAIPVDKGKVEQTVLANLPGAVLVVGHSDSIPKLVLAFGGPDVEINGYDNLFIIIRANGVTRFIHGRYGAPSP
jgi:phosphohistidine phosphatase SixA